jgi:hypothetical protein
VCVFGREEKTVKLASATTDFVANARRRELGGSISPAPVLGAPRPSCIDLLDATPPTSLSGCSVIGRLISVRRWDHNWCRHGGDDDDGHRCICSRCCGDKFSIAIDYLMVAIHARPHDDDVRAENMRSEVGRCTLAILARWTHARDGRWQQR